MDGMKKRIYCSCIVMLLFLLGGCKSQSVEPLEEVYEETETEPQEEMQQEKIYVYVCGQVVNPGVYQLPEGSRLYEAIALSGGILDTGEASFLNQAECLMDGQMIYIPSKEEVRQNEEAAVSSFEAGKEDRIDLNKGSLEELVSLPGIGEKKAEAIISHRESNGPFKSIENLMDVEGIKEGTYNKIKDKIKV